MAMGGPTSMWITPSPFETTFQIGWEGLWYDDLTPRDRYWYYWIYTSPDNATWTGVTGGSRNHYVGNVWSGTFTPDIPAVADGHYIKYEIRPIGYGANGNKYYSGKDYTLIVRKILPTACGAPTACSVNTTVSEGNATLSWSGAKAGTSNAINSYEIQYSESANGSSWGAWTALATVNSTATSGSLTVAPPTTRGYYRRYQVRTRGARGAALYSGWKVSTNTLRRNTLPGAPTVFTASPAAYTTENITLSWSGAAAGTSPIKQYVIQRQESTNNMASWSAWTNVSTITSAATSGSSTVTPTRVLDAYTQYRICAQDTLNCLSGYKTSGSIYSIALPFAPVVQSPKQGGTTYNSTPKLLIETQDPPGSKAQTICVKAPDGVTYNSVDHPDMFSVSGAPTKAVKTVFSCPDTGVGDKSVTVYCRSVGDGAAVQRSFTVAASPFSAIIAGETHVKAAHITALRTAADSLRSYYGLAAAQWADAITAGRTNVAYWPQHMQELRAALQPVLEKLAQYGAAPAITQAGWLPLGTGRPRADVMQQLADAILAL